MKIERRLNPALMNMIYLPDGGVGSNVTSVAGCGLTTDEVRVQVASNLLHSSLSHCSKPHGSIA